MKNIQSTHATFEQAKLLKEKGFNISCKEGWYVAQLDPYKGKLFPDDTGGKHEIEKPEQWQIVEWLRVNHNIDLQNICNYGRLGRTYRMGIIFINEKKEVDTIFLRPIDTPFKFIEFKSPQEAYSAAFDYILKELI